MTEPVRKDSREDRVWEQGWEEHSRLQLKRLAMIPLPEKLIWLEEAHRLILHMQSAADPMTKE
jgi:hypothetical protein